MTTLIILNVYLLHPTNSDKLDKHGLSYVVSLFFTDWTYSFSIFKGMLWLNLLWWGLSEKAHIGYMNFGNEKPDKNFFFLFPIV